MGCGTPHLADGLFPQNTHNLQSDTNFETRQKLWVCKKQNRAWFLVVFC